jgi:hypothetical protein
MHSIQRVGFFHFGGHDKSDPLKALEEAIAKCAASDLRNSLLVLPEGFNVRGGLYVNDPRLDPQAWSHLQHLAVKQDMVFVAGLIEHIKGPNSAFLVDGTNSPPLLTRKHSACWDILYAPHPTDETRAILSRSVAIAALICDDAGLWGKHEEKRNQLLSKVAKLKADRRVLCVPAFMTITDSLATARLWSESITVVVANGSAQQSSVIIDGGSVTTPQHTDQNEIGLRDLWYTIERCIPPLDDGDLDRCLSIIRSGGAVDVDPERLRRALAVVVARREGQIVGVAAVKGIRPGYVGRIAERSRFPLERQMPELGYVAVDGHHQGKGLSHRLVAELIRGRTEAIFATTDDDRMKRTLAAAGFAQKGQEWAGTRGQLSLWVRT